MKVPATGLVVGAAMWVGLVAMSAAVSTAPVRTVKLGWGMRAAETGSDAKDASTGWAARGWAERSAETKTPAGPSAAPFLRTGTGRDGGSVGAAAKRLGGEQQRTILVSLADRKLALLVNGEVAAVYPVAVGKASRPSPVGDFTIISHVANPTYSHKGKVVGPGPGNPVGTRWIGLSERGYGIHGTNAPGSIGKPASHGCIRMGRTDLEQLFAMVETGDVVEIRGERDAQVAAVFGEAANGTNTVVAAKTDPAAAQPVQMAAAAGVRAAAGAATRGGE